MQQNDTAENGELADAWVMYASADAPGSGRPLRFFGPLGFSAQDTTASRVVEVLVRIVDDPQEGDYWAWMDPPPASQPCHIASTEEQMTKGFLLNQPDAPGPREEEQIGLGRIVRLRVQELGDVRLRSGRKRWKVTSAL